MQEDSQDTRQIQSHSSTDATGSSNEVIVTAFSTSDSYAKAEQQSNPHDRLLSDKILYNMRNTEHMYDSRNTDNPYNTS